MLRRVYRHVFTGNRTLTDETYVPGRQETQTERLDSRDRTYDKNTKYSMETRDVCKMSTITLSNDS